eukprot:3580041-Alexandrium_andersonii.AAC.1
MHCLTLCLCTALADLWAWHACGCHLRPGCVCPLAHPRDGYASGCHLCPGARGALPRLSERAALA